MRYRLFGDRTGLFVSQLALGAGMFGNRWGYGASLEESSRMLNRYIDAGGNFVDTSNRYQEGESEEVLGSLLTGIRENVVLATKYGRPINTDFTLPRVGGHRKGMVEAVEASLKRLKTDRIDVYFMHMDDLYTPMEEIARGFEDLVSAGKILYPALSNFPAWRTARAVTLADLRGWTGVSAIQVEYNLLQRTTESEVLPMAKALGLGILTYSPLAGGLLTLKYRKGGTGRATEFPAGIQYFDQDNEKIYQAIEAVAVETNCTPAQVATAWVCAKDTFPLAGPRVYEQLDDYLAAATLELTDAQMAHLEAASHVELSYPNELIHSAKERNLNTAGYVDRIDKPYREAP